MFDPAYLIDAGRSQELGRLKHDNGAPCLPEGQSSKWSCVRFTPKAADGCGKWPTESIYGCTGAGGDWQKLSNYVSHGNCRTLCKNTVADVGSLCCLADKARGCYAKPGASISQETSDSGSAVVCTQAAFGRRQVDLYGFKDMNEAQHRPIGETFDRGYVRHIPSMPRVAVGPGYLKMNFTDKLKSLLLPWYAQRIKDSVTHESIIGGGYTNNHVIPTNHIDLDAFPEVHQEIVREMRYVLQWWTQQELKHTSSFGIRIYRRGNMLINHVDREDTHLASAVLQVHQEADDDGGWPLEVISEKGDRHEVFLQPGEMVLYEGGKFQHGRPMRFRGKEFANVFSHFAPMHWYGPEKSPKFVSSRQEL